MRFLAFGALIVAAIVMFSPDHGKGLMNSVVHGFGWGIGREIAHGMFGHRHW